MQKGEAITSPFCVCMASPAETFGGGVRLKLGFNK